MKDLGEVKRILGMDIIRDRKAGKLWLSQRDYVHKMLKKFHYLITDPLKRDKGLVNVLLPNRHDTIPFLLLKYDGLATELLHAPKMVDVACELF